MFVTSIFISIWLNLFDRYNTILFSIVFIFVFLMEIYILITCIATYLSLSWLHRDYHSLIYYPLKFLWSIILNNSLGNHENQNLLSNEYIFEISNIPLQNRSRRLMLLKLYNLFRRTKSNTPMDSDNIANNNKYSLFDYRCPICFNHKQSTSRWIVLGCGHILCSQCTQHLYFGNKPMCPNCRSPIILSDLTILYI